MVEKKNVKKLINRGLTENQRKAAITEKLRKKHAVTQGEKKICLTMIVRNESKNMERVLNSIMSVANMVSIVDTGSTDNTEEVIVKWGETNNMPTVVHHEPFKNFSYNRTHSIRMAKKSFPDADYFLLSDADFVWEVNKGGKFDKILLIDHKYLIEQYNKSLSYWNIRLLSAKVDWECVGVTHEYWCETKNQTNHTGAIRAAKIHTLAIDDKEDGGHKNDKFIRDERLLRGGLADPEAPENVKTRYKFYLAQTLKDLGQHHESIEWYTKRVQDKGWDEEVYYAKYQIGFNYERLAWNTKQCIEWLNKSDKTVEQIDFLMKHNPDNNNLKELEEKTCKYFDNCLVNYLGAYNYRKVRAEGLYHATRVNRTLNKHQIAYDLAKKGKKIAYPEVDTLFIEDACYDYLFDLEISIVAFYLPDKKEEGREVCGKLLQRTDIPEWYKNVIENNSRHYI